MTKREKCLRYEEQFVSEWERIAAQLQSCDNCMWMIRHASYLLKTSGVLWGVDLTLRTSAMLDSVACRIGGDLGNLAFILTSHFHSDHFNEPFMRTIAANGTLWVLPAFTQPELLAGLQAIHPNILTVSPGDRFTVKGIEIAVLCGRHTDAGKTSGAQSLRFFVRAPGKMLYFPGDTRDYSPEKEFPEASPDVMPAHLWFGRRMALDPCEVECEAFCRYFASFAAKRILLTHLYNFSRETEDDIWTEKHAAQAIACFSGMGVKNVDAPAVGELIEL